MASVNETIHTKPGIDQYALVVFAIIAKKIPKITTENDFRSRQSLQ